MFPTIICTSILCNLLYVKSAMSGDKPMQRLRTFCDGVDLGDVYDGLRLRTSDDEVDVCDVYDGLRLHAFGDVGDHTSGNEVGVGDRISDDGVDVGDGTCLFPKRLS